MKVKNYLSVLSVLFGITLVFPCYAGTLVPMQNKKGMWGYVDSDNCMKFVIAASFEDAFPFSDGLACVKKNGSYGFIDPSGNLTISPGFDSSSIFKNGYALCSKKGMKGIIDKKGNICLPFEYSEISQTEGCFYYEGKKTGNLSTFIIQIAPSHLCKVTEVQSISKCVDKQGRRYYVKDGSYNIFNAKGGPIFKSVIDENNGFCRAKIAGDSAIYVFANSQIDTAPHVYRFQDIKEESGFLFGKQNNGWGLMNRDYLYITEDSFSEVIPIRQEYVILSSGSSSKLSDKEGVTILDNISEAKRNNNRWQLTRISNGKTNIFYIDNKSEFGLIINGNLVPINGDLCSIQEIGELTVWQKDANSFGVINKDGKLIWSEFNPVKISHLCGDYYAISSYGSSIYRLAKANGKIYDYSLCEIKNCKEAGILEHTHNGDTIYLFLRGTSPLSLSDFNYNSFCSFYDLETKKYGKMNESFKIITSATLTTEPDVPYGTKWLKGSVFSAMQRFYGTWYGIKMWFPKGDSNFVTFISYKSSYNPYEAQAYMNLGAENDRNGCRYSIRGNRISIVGSADCTINWSSRTITQADGTVFRLESSSYSSPLSSTSERPIVISTKQNEATNSTIYSTKPKKHLFNGYVSHLKTDQSKDKISVTIRTSPSDATVHIDGTIMRSAQLSPSNHHLEISAKRYRPVICDFKPTNESKELHFSLPHQYQQKNQGYLNAGYQFGSLSSIGVSAGCYIYNVNIEGNYCYGLKHSENLYWFNNEGYAPAIYSYSPQYIGCKIGYGIIIGSRFRLTPQAGIGAILLKGKVIDPGYSDPGATSAYQVSAQADLKIDFAITTWLGLYVTPSYYFQVKDSPLYKRLSEKSSTIANYGKGFNTQVGLSLTF